jgi:hypothetical protein
MIPVLPIYAEMSDFPPLFLFVIIDENENAASTCFGDDRPGRTQFHPNHWRVGLRNGFGLHKNFYSTSSGAGVGAASVRDRNSMAIRLNRAESSICAQ